MPDLTANLIAEANTLHGSGIWPWLFELRRDSTNVSYYTSHDIDVVFDGQTYTHKNIKFQPPKEDAQGGTPRFTVTIENVDRVEMAYIVGGKYRDQSVTVRLVNLNHTGASDVIEYYSGLILDIPATEKWATFNCGVYDLRDIPLPGRCAFRDHCVWDAFMDDNCKYAGGESTCTRQYDYCKATMSNTANFGGFHETPIQREP